MESVHFIRDRYLDIRDYNTYIKLIVPVVVTLFHMLQLLLNSILNEPQAFSRAYLWLCRNWGS